MDVEFLRYQFEDGYYGVITKNGFKIGVRHLQMVYMVAISVVMGFIRGSMGVAVLAVNDQTRRNDTYIQIHNWDGKIQGAVLFPFFFGYAMMVLPSEMYFKKIGGLLSVVILFVNGALFGAMPTIINKGGWVAACNANLFIGMSHACLFTINQSLIDQWLPPNEKKFFNHIVYGGIQIGIIIALPVTGLLSTARLGWELIYYTLAIMGLSMAVITGTLTASSPDEHQAVGDTEKEFIRETMSYYRKKQISRPWRDILRSPQFWALTSAHAASNVLFIFFLVHVPAYLLIFGISLKDSSWYSMLPFISMTLANTILSPIFDWIYSIRYFNYRVSATCFRKVINALGASGIAIGLTMLPNIPREWSCAGIILLTSILGLQGFQFCGFLNSYKDMSENFSGTLMMISCAVSSLVGAAVPFVTGLIIGDNVTDINHWRVIMLSLASIYIVSIALYTMIGSHDRQYWDHISRNKRDFGHNDVKGVNRVRLEHHGHINLALKKYENDTEL